MPSTSDASRLGTSPIRMRTRSARRGADSCRGMGSPLASDSASRRAMRSLRSSVCQGFLRRFQAEARAAAALSHPNIMAIYDWGEDEDTPYLVCEYLAGGSLRALLDAGNRLSPSQALLLGLEAARGLEYAHRRSLVHR